MAADIVVPTLGESITEATVVQWLKSEGEAVNVDEPLVELETDKVTVEVPAPVGGVLMSHKVGDGDTVEVGTILGSIDESAIPQPVKSAPANPPVASNGSGQAISSQSAVSMPPSPAAGKIMAERGLNISQISGSGKRGQILKEDALNAKTNVSNGIISGLSDSEREERVKMTKLRQTIAKRLKGAQETAAMLTTFNEVDMTNVMQLRSQYKELFEKKHGVKLGFMSFFVKACIAALRDIPEVNAEIDGNDIVYKNYYHIGVAVGTDKGLVVPVVHDADAMSLADIEKSITGYGRKARDGQIKIEDMQGGTFTISNGGVYGSLMSTPILNAPQSGILGMHKIQPRPIAIDDKIEVRPMMYLALSYDHRIVDGKGAVTFLVRVKENLEDPQRLVLDL